MQQKPACGNIQISQQKICSARLVIILGQDQVSLSHHNAERLGKNGFSWYAKAVLHILEL